jgi:hypothetical protein
MSFFTRLFEKPIPKVYICVNRKYSIIYYSVRYNEEFVEWSRAENGTRNVYFVEVSPGGIIDTLFS